MYDMDFFSSENMSNLTQLVSGKVKIWNSELLESKAQLCPLSTPGLPSSSQPQITALEYWVTYLKKAGYCFDPSFLQASISIIDRLVHESIFKAHKTMHTLQPATRKDNILSCLFEIITVHLCFNMHE